MIWNQQRLKRKTRNPKRSKHASKTTIRTIIISEALAKSLFFTGFSVFTIDGPTSRKLLGLCMIHNRELPWSYRRYIMLSQVCYLLESKGSDPQNFRLYIISQVYISIKASRGLVYGLAASLEQICFLEKLESLNCSLKNYPPRYTLLSIIRKASLDQWVQSFGWFHHTYRINSESFTLQVKDFHGSKLMSPNIDESGFMIYMPSRIMLACNAFCVSPILFPEKIGQL